MSKLIAVTIATLLKNRTPGATICPSEIARYIGGADWRKIMPDIHRTAHHVARLGAIIIWQNGTPQKPDNVIGPYRIGRRTGHQQDKA